MSSNRPGTLPLEGRATRWFTVAARCRRLLAAGAVASMAWSTAPAHAQSAGAQAQASSAPSTGILLMAHGGSKDWNANVQAIAAEADRTMPTEVALGMADRTTLQQAIDRLTARGVKQIVAVPLFVSSHSSVIESTKYLLGLRADAPKELADFAMMNQAMDGGGGMGGMDMGGHAAGRDTTPPPLPQPVHFDVPLRMTTAFDHHAIIADILADRAAAIAKDPKHSAVILVAHGPVGDAENALWLDDMGALAKMVATHAPYARVETVTLRDDADAPVRDQATENLRKTVAADDAAGYHVLIVPLLLSYGGIENGLRQRLDGIEHTLSPQALLPDARIVQWVLTQAGEALRP